MYLSFSTAKIIRLAIAIPLLLLLALKLADATAWVSYPFQIDYAEGILLNQSALIANGQTPYHPITEYPFIVSSYSPIYILLCALFHKFLGPTFLVGRLISFASTLGIAVLIYYILRKTVSRSLSFFSALLFLVSPYVLMWGSLMRVDPLAVIFSTFGLFIVWKYGNSSKALMAVPIFWLAIFTRQTLIAAPLAASLYLFMLNRRLAIQFFISFTLGTLMIFGIINLISGGQYYLHTVAYNVNAFYPSTLIEWFINVLSRTHPILLAVAIGTFLYHFTTRTHMLFSFYAVLAFFMSLTIGKTGANINYFLEIFILMPILTGFALSDYFNSTLRSTFANYLLLAMVFIQLSLFTNVPVHFISQKPNPVFTDATRLLINIVRNTQGPILSEDAGIVVLAQKDFIFEPFIMTQLYKEGRWNQITLVSDLANRRFSLIVLYFDVDRYPGDFPHNQRFTPEMIQQIRLNYTKQPLGHYFLYSPKS